MRKSRTLAPILSAAGLSILLSGCLGLAAGAAAGAAGLAYIQGALQGTVDASPQKFIDAAQATLKEMGFAVQETAADEAEGHINARTANDRDINITAEKKTENTTSVRIRIGTFGDEELSREIYNRTVEKL